ncbi:uncharacterized protein [Prorops nasuta]
MDIEEALPGPSGRVVEQELPIPPTRRYRPPVNVALPDQAAAAAPPAPPQAPPQGQPGPNPPPRPEQAEEREGGNRRRWHKRSRRAGWRQGNAACQRMAIMLRSMADEAFGGRGRGGGGRGRGRGRGQ